MKRILSILCCVLILGAMRLSAQTVEVTIDNIKYSCTGTTAEVSGYGTKPAGALVIPSEVTTDGNTYTVTSIGNNAFYYCSGLTSIELPASLTSIGNSAFSDCYGLTSIELPASLTAIGNSAFYDCSKLTLVISLRTTLIAISSNVFDNVSSKVLYIPEGGEALAAYQSADVWKSFGTIVQGKPIIQVINGIKYLCYENEAKVIGYETMLTGVLAIPSEVTTDGNTYTVTSIGNSAFRSCTGLTSIELPASLTSIGNSAFSGCSGLTSIELPASLTSIGDAAFSGCYGLTSIELPASLTSIGNSAFSGCLGLTSIELPASLTSIGNSAFSDCFGLTSIELPASLTSIGNDAFRNCRGLTSIELPASLTSIGERAFSSCFKLTLVTSLRTTPIAISSNVFDNVSSKMLSIPEGEEVLAAYQSADVWKDFGTIVQGKPIIQVINGIKYLCNENEAKVIGYETMLTGVLAIPSEVTTDGNTYTVTSIGNEAFDYCLELTSIELPASLTSIGDYAFYYCSGLTSIELPASLTSIGEGAFAYCSGLTSIELPASLTSIVNGAFFNCWGLTSIELPASLTSIGNYAFDGCFKLTDIIYWGITEPFIGIGIVSSEIELWLPNASAGFTASNWNAHTIHYGSVPVSVSSLESEELRCYASQQEIVVTSSQNLPLTITNLYGVTIYSGKTIDGTTRVSVTQSGVYIVRVGLKSFKVAVQ